MSEPSVNSKIRLLGGDRRRATSRLSRCPPGAAQAAAPPVSITPPPPLRSRRDPIFLGNSVDGADVLGATELVQPLAQLCVTPQVQTPFLAAVAGASGAGKTFALGRLAQAIVELSASSAASGGALARAVVAHVDAGAASRRRWRSPAPPTPRSIASPAASTIRRLLDETGHAGGDPHRAARAASDRHDDMVQEARGRALAPRRRRGQARPARRHSRCSRPRARASTFSPARVAA